MGDQGFDDQFNDRVFRTTFHNSKQYRPRLWPKSVSEMRPYTSYANQGMTDNDMDISHSNFIMRRPAFVWKDVTQRRR